MCLHCSDLESCEEKYQDDYENDINDETAPFNVNSPPYQNTRSRQVPQSTDAHLLLKEVEEKHEEMITLMRKNNIKIDNLDDPMQKLAFTFFTEIGELSRKAELFRLEHQRGEQR